MSQKHWPGCWYLALFLLAKLGAEVCSQQAPPLPAGKDQTPEVVDGLFVSVRNPIDSKVAQRVIETTKRFLDRPGHQGLKLVYDFNPDGYAASTSDYGTCRDLARYLLSLQDVTTIAFVHNEVSGHTVLPVLACKEIIFSEKGKLGDALRGQPEHQLEDDIVVFYDLVAKRRNRFPAIILKMLDKDVEVIEGRRRNGDLWYVDKRREAEETKAGFRRTVLDPTLPAGSRALYEAAQADKFGLCEHLRVENREGIKDAYHLPLSSLREDPLQGRSPNAWRLVISGQVNRKMQESLDRQVRRAIHKGANLLVFQLECGEGETQVARELGDFFRTLMDDKKEHPVMTIAYVTKQARNTAAFLALGCTEIVMDQDAMLGDFERIVKERPDYQEPIAKSLEELAEKQGYPAVLARGLLDPKVTIYQVHSQKGKFTERRLIEGDEWEEDRKGDRKWVQEETVKEAGKWWNLKSDAAKRLDVAKHVFKGQLQEFVPWLADKYGLDAVQDSGLDWLDEVATFLCNPVVSVFLVMIGITGLILELKIPGVGLPGVVSALCFVLYFWAHHDAMRGHLTMLAVLLFLLGLILIGLEIFVVPGLGVTGFSGIVLVIVSLGLVTLVKRPETTREWIDFGATLSTLGLSLVGAVVGALVLAWYLPHIPYVNRLVLAPPGRNADALEEEAALAQGNMGLLGAIGEAATTLRPAGKARFGDEYLDVVAEGSFVEEGARVQVVEIEGNRIVVKEI
jgi:membrane-bound ClpP family serine protease